VLEVVEALVQVNGRLDAGRVGVGKDETDDAAHFLVRSGTLGMMLSTASDDATGRRSALSRKKALSDEFDVQ